MSVQSKSEVLNQEVREGLDESFDWTSLPFLLLHVGCLLGFWIGWSWTAVIICILSLELRMFGITGAYHRYFSHRSYRTSRFFQFCLAFLGTCAVQKGPLWWAAHHRHHHRYSDTDLDIHSPIRRNFWWSHWGWILSKRYKGTEESNVRDWQKFPELYWLDRHYVIPPLTYLAAIGLLGFGIERGIPGLHTSALHVIFWGFLVSTVLCYHCTFAINSVAHVFGRQRFDTGDKSRNSLLLALLTLGEGWHNNHHRFPSSERQGFYWWEIDITHYILKMLNGVGLVWDLRIPPQRIYEEARQNRENVSIRSSSDSVRKDLDSPGDAA